MYLCKYIICIYKHTRVYICAFVCTHIHKINSTCSNSIKYYVKTNIYSFIDITMTVSVVIPVSTP